jgi:ElaB/YqjD/DUF883 family membrane-anchored ribosome-binding protein
MPEPLSWHGVCSLAVSPPTIAEEKELAMNETASSMTGSSATQTAHDTIERAHDTVERATQTAHRAVDRASEGARRLSVSGQELTDELGAYVSTHPVQTLAIALATGFILGRLMR